MGTKNIAMKRRTDWADLIEKAKRKPGVWLEVGDDYPGATRTYLKRRYEIDARITGQNPATSRGTLWIRWNAA